MFIDARRHQVTLSNQESSSNHEFLAAGGKLPSPACAGDTGSGNYQNGRAFENYFPTETLRMVAASVCGHGLKRIKATSAECHRRRSLPARLAGTGHGIARALLKADINLRPTLKSEGLLTRDSREKERKEVFGQPGARKRFQQTLIPFDFFPTPQARPRGVFRF